MRLRPGLIFKREAGPEIRRLFAGPLLPGAPAAARPAAGAPRCRSGLVVQSVHAADVAEAYRLAALSAHAHGAYNIAADPVLDAGELARVLGSRAVSVPARVVRALADVTYRARLQPAPAGLARHGPGRADDVHRTGTDAAGLDAAPHLRAGAAGAARGHAMPHGAPTPPLDAHAGGRFRQRELRIGRGAR